LYPAYQYKVWESIHKNGNSCDYTCESIIQKSKVENGFLKYGNRKYHTLMLLEVETMQPATAKALSNFVAKGGKLIFVAKEPYKSPGLKNHKNNDKEVAKTIAAMKKANPSRIFTVEAPGDDVVVWFAKVQQQCDIKPYIQIDKPNAAISQIRHNADGKDIFFISNADTDNGYVLNVAFPEAKGTPWLWNAETGERFLYPLAQGNKLTVELPPATTQLIVFDTLSDGPKIPAKPAETEGSELKEWTLRLEHINGTEHVRNITSLFDMASDETTRSFAGHLYYEKQLSTDNSKYHWLDLGKVYGVSEVSIDGEKLGCRWYGRHLYRLPDKTGGKKLQIKITTTVGNFLKSSLKNETGQGWTRGQQWSPVGLIGPVKLL
jgi:hypothetical protein